MTEQLNILKHGAKSEGGRKFQAAMNRRLLARDMDQYKVREDGVIGAKTLDSARKAAWILGALPETYERIIDKQEIAVGVQGMVRNPGHRTDSQKSIAADRLRYFRLKRYKMKSDLASVSLGRRKFVDLAHQAAKNYEANPGAYHYLSGGVANLIFLQPAPSGYRSDCSQFASAVQHAAGLPDLGPNGPLWVNTWVMDSHLKLTTNPSPGDFGMYGPRGDPHHVELYCALPGAEFIGHGSPPIDSLTPGRPTYYLENPVK